MERISYSPLSILYQALAKIKKEARGTRIKNLGGFSRQTEISCESVCHSVDKVQTIQMFSFFPVDS